MDIRLLDEAEASRLPKVILVLAANAPAFTSRDALLEALWSTVPPETGRNRLRVALSRLRAEFALEEGDEGVRLNPDRVTIDVLAAMDALEAARHEPDAEQEWRVLVSLLPVWRKRVLPRRTESWLNDLQVRWSLSVAEGTTTLVRLARDRSDASVQLEAAEVGLIHFPQDSGFWSAKLLAMKQLGRAKEAKREFSEVRRSLLAASGDPDEELLRVARSLDEDDEDAQFTPNETDLVLRTLHRAMESDPEVAVAFLGSVSFRPEMLRSPVEGLRLLREVARHALPESEALARVRVRIVTCLSLLQQNDEVIDESAKILAYEQHPHRRRIILLNRSWSLLQVGRFDEAFEAVEEAIRLAEATDYELDAWQCRAQRAAFLLLIGKGDEALPILQDALSYLRMHGRSVDRDTLVIAANLGLAHLLLGQADEATQVLRPVRKAAKANGVADAQGLCEPILGFILAQEGVSSEAKECLMSGLRFAYRFGPREATVALGFAVAALHRWGHPESKSLAGDWYALVLSAHVWLPAPQQWVADRAGLTGQPQRPTPDLLATVRAVVRAVREHAVMP